MSVSIDARFCSQYEMNGEDMIGVYPEGKDYHIGPYTYTAKRAELARVIPVSKPPNPSTM